MLLKDYTPREGWKIYNLDYGLTWVNAIAFSAIKTYQNNTDVLELLYRNEVASLEESRNMLEDRSPTNNKNIFIVHGHDQYALNEIQLLLIKEFGLNPIVANKYTNKAFEAILPKIRRLISDCHSAIVLLTPDDLVLKDDVEYMQARPNVILEIGICMEKLNGRVILIRKDGCNLFSDIHGLIFIDYKKHIAEREKDIKEQLHEFGSLVKM